MSVTVVLPELGESVVEGTIARWLVKAGDRVRRDQPLVEVTTDKVDAEIPAPEDGIVEKLLVAEGETVAVGTALLLLAPAAGQASAGAAGARSEAQPSEVGRGAGAAGARSEAQPSEVGRGAGAAGARSEAQPSEVGRRAGSVGARSEAQPSEVGRRAGSVGARSEAQPSEVGGRTGAPRATPAARRLAEAEGVDLGRARPSGPGGRVTRSDVARVAATPEVAAPPAPPESASTASGPRPVAATLPGGGRRPSYLTYHLQPGDRVVPMSPLRKIVAEHMVLSKQIAPHVGTVTEVDMAGVVRLRDQHKRAFREQHGFGLTFLPFIVHAAVRALREYPRLNASVLEDAIVEKQGIHMGVAVETEKGLVVPVVRDADRLSLTGLAEAIEDLSGRARTKQLSPDELRGGTFTVSNPGRHGNLYGFAIINQPQVGILRMGEIVKRPVVRERDGEEAIVIRPIMHLALSYDHRAVDGAPANGFLHRVRELLEAGAVEL
jgi:pyruvate/2-oxoglutarate dehydrogenase complex dihydrolipoamide acyltransferase (E2) component